MRSGEAPRFEALHELPCEVTLDPVPSLSTPPSSSSTAAPPQHPHHPHWCGGAPAKEGREVERPRGQSLFLFGSRGSLGETWRENGCIRARVGGVKILILLKNSWFEFFLTCPHLSPSNIPATHQPALLSANPGR